MSSATWDWVLCEYVLLLKCSWCTAAYKPFFRSAFIFQNVWRDQMHATTNAKEENRFFFFLNSRSPLPFPVYVLNFQQLPPLHSHQNHLFSIFFHSKEKTGEREDDVWQMPYFDFLSGRLILTHCVSYQGLVDCVLDFDFIIFCSATFFLRIRQ